MELGHNPLSLISRKLLVVKDGKAAERFLDRFCASKRDRGYRLRYVAEKGSAVIELGARGAEQMRMAVRALKDSGLFVKEVPFKYNTMIQRV